MPERLSVPPWPKKRYVNTLPFLSFIYTFLGLLLPNGILQNSLSVQVLHSPILAVLLHGTRAAAIIQTL